MMNEEKTLAVYRNNAMVLGGIIVIALGVAWLSQSGWGMLSLVLIGKWIDIETILDDEDDGGGEDLAPDDHRQDERVVTH
jgi:hypothetical protein